MLNPKERNDFLAENYALLNSIITHNVKVIHHRFPKLHIADINGYAWLGIVRALDKIDVSQPAWETYLKRTAFGYALSGALQMSGVYRQRTSDDSAYIPDLLEAADAGDFEEIMEGIQAGDEQFGGRMLFDKLISFDEQIWFTKLIEGSVEHAIFVRLLLGESLVEISEKHQIKIRTLRRFMAQLRDVHDEAVKGNPIQHLLTPLRSESDKYASLMVTKDMLNRLQQDINEEMS